MTNQPVSVSDRTWIIEAKCTNCNKQFTSMNAVSMHLKVTAARHAVSFIIIRKQDFEMSRSPVRFDKDYGKK